MSTEAVIRALLAVARDARSDAGHRLMTIVEARSGHCRYTKHSPTERTYHCGPKCRELSRVIREAEAWLGEHATVPTQIPLGLVS